MNGESVPHIMRRTEEIYGSNKAAAERAVRTAVTYAENKGRLFSYERAIAMGIKGEQMWMTTRDGRARLTHRAADEQKVKIGEPFDVGGAQLECPGDPSGPPEEVYNCRCSMSFIEEGTSEEYLERWDRLPDDMEYEDWKSGDYVTDRHNVETAASKRARGL